MNRTMIVVFGLLFGGSLLLACTPDNKASVADSPASKAATSAPANKLSAPTSVKGTLKASDGKAEVTWYEIAPAPGKTFTFSLKAEGDLVLAFKDSAGKPMFYKMEGDSYPDLPGDKGVSVSVESKGGAGTGGYELAVGVRN